MDEKLKSNIDLVKRFRHSLKFMKISCGGLLSIAKIIDDKFQFLKNLTSVVSISCNTYNIHTHTHTHTHTHPCRVAGPASGASPGGG